MELGVIIFAAIGWGLAALFFIILASLRSQLTAMRDEWRSESQMVYRYRDRVDELLDELDELKHPKPKEKKIEEDIEVDSTVLDWLR